MLPLVAAVQRALQLVAKEQAEPCLLVGQERPHQVSTLQQLAPQTAARGWASPS